MIHSVVRAHEPGPPEVMRLDEVPGREVGPREAGVRVAAAGVNFIDIQQRRGAYKVSMPFELGIEGSGVIEALGPDTPGRRIGERVAWVQVPGSYASTVVAPIDKLVTLPEAIDLDRGAAALEHGMTAHYLCTATHVIRSGETVLVHAAAGGVGQFVCQFAKMAGARVIGTVSARAKRSVAEAAGADHVIDYAEQDFVAEVRRLTSGRGVDVVYDGVGRTTFLKSLDCLRPRGIMVAFGQASGAPDPFDTALLGAKGSLYVTRPSLNHYTLTADEYRSRARAVLDGIASGVLRVRIDRRLPMDRVADAHRAIEARETTGKVLLIP